jgi:hypothetical protein
MRRFNQCWLCGVAALSILFLTGCKTEDPNPELLDPVYVDLDKRANDFKKAYDEQVKMQDEARATIEKSDPNTLELRNARADLLKSEHKALDFDQKARYFEIRAKRRLYVDRLTYKEALAKNKVWPDPKEYSEYLVNMRLQDAPRNWNIRVPKLSARLPSSIVSEKKAPEAPKKEE